MKELLMEVLAWLKNDPGPAIIFCIFVLLPGLFGLGWFILKMFGKV